MLLKYKKRVISTKQNASGTRSRFNSVFLLFLTISSIATTLPVLQSTNVSAQAQNWSATQAKDQNPDWQIKSLIYYNAMSTCVHDSGFDGPGWDSGSISGDNLNSYSWFTNGALANTTVSVGVYMGESLGKDSKWDGKIKCSDAALIKGALDIWGMTDHPGAILCGSGWTMTTDSKLNTCNTGKPNSADNYISPDKNKDQIVSDFDGFIKNQVYDGQNPNLNLYLNLDNTTFDLAKDAYMYLFYLGSINNSCIKGIKTTSPGTNIKEPNPPIAYGYYNVKWVGNDGKIITGGYNNSIINSGILSSDTNINLAPIVNIDSSGLQVSGGNLQYTCKQAVEKMSSFALNYSALFSKAKDAGITIDTTTYTPEPASTTTSSCTVPGVGWIICPVVNLLSGLADGMFNILTRFLSTSPDIFTFKDQTTGLNPTFNAWSAMRSIANVAFVIVFLIIIFSQITSVGITNYGIKKMLPRLIIAAILVNVSYYICQIAVDLSNILGFSLQSFMVGLIPGTTDTTGIWSGNTWTNLIGHVLLLSVTGLAVMYGALAFFIPAILAAIVALIMILFILISRQALIILLIVISPLAFVAFLLPNTSDWFKKWQNAFTTMLLLFPIVAMVFGASKLASGILKNVYTTDMIGQIAAATILVVPLFVVPGLLKKALDGVGGIGTKMNGWGDKLGGIAGKKGSEVYENTALARGIAGRAKSNQTFRDQNYARKLGTSKWTRALSGGIPLPTDANRFARDRQLSSAMASVDKADKEDVQAESILLKSLKPNTAQNRLLASGGSIPGFDASKSHAKRAAAIDAMVASGDTEGINNLWNESKTWTGTTGDKLREKFADSLQASSSRPTYLSQGAIAQMRQNSHKSLDDTVKSAIESNAYSAAKIAAGDGDELATVSRIAFGEGSTVSQQDKNALAANADAAFKNPTLATQIAKNINQATSIRNGVEHTDSNPGQKPLF